MRRFEWGQFLALAHGLRGGSDAERRSAVSRAYYAAFHAMDRVYKALGSPDPPPRGKRRWGSHERVWLAGDGALSKTDPAYGLGFDLKKLRLIADYRDAEHISDGNIADALEWAQQIRDAVDRWFAARATKH